MNGQDHIPVIVMYGVAAVFVLAWLGAMFGSIFVIALGIVFPAVLLMAGMMGRSTR